MRPMYYIWDRDKGKIPVHKGLCDNKGDHEAHEYKSETLGIYWCTADQSQREPYRSEQRRKNETT